MEETKKSMEKYRKAYSILVKKLRQKKNLSKETLEKIEETKLNDLSNGNETIEENCTISHDSQSEEEHLDVGGNDSPELIDSDLEEDSRVCQKKKDTDFRNEIVNTYPCDICGAFFRSLKNLNLHHRIHELRKKEGKKSQERKRWSCGSCFSNFITEKLFLTHCCKDKTTGADDSSEEDIQCLDELFNCTDCYAVFRKKEDLEEHKKFNHYTNHVCNICSKSFMLKAAYDKHIEIHKTVREYHCKLCSKICKTQAALKKHNVVHQRDILNLALTAINSNEDVVKKIEVKSTEKKQLMLGCSVQLGQRLPLNMEVTCEDDEPQTEIICSPKKRGKPKRKAVISRYKRKTKTKSKAKPKKPISSKSYEKSVGSVPNKDGEDSDISNQNNPVLLPEAPPVPSTNSIVPTQKVCINIDDNKPKCQLCYRSFENQEELLNHIEIHLGRRIAIRGNARKPKAISTSNADDPEIVENGSTGMPVIENTCSLAKQKEAKQLQKKRGRKPKKSLNTARVSGRERPLKRNPEPILLPRPEPFASPRPSGTPRPHDEHGGIFDPNYIIKLEPEDKEGSSPTLKKKRITKSLAKVFVRISNDGTEEKCVKALKYMESFKELSINLNRV